MNCIQTIDDILEDLFSKYTNKLKVISELMILKEYDLQTAKYIVEGYLFINSPKQKD